MFQEMTQLLSDGIYLFGSPEEVAHGVEGDHGEHDEHDDHRQEGPSGARGTVLVTHSGLPKIRNLFY